MTHILPEARVLDRIDSHQWEEIATDASNLFFGPFELIFTIIILDDNGNADNWKSYYQLIAVFGGFTLFCHIKKRSTSLFPIEIE